MLQKWWATTVQCIYILDVSIVPRTVRDIYRCRHQAFSHAQCIMHILTLKQKQILIEYFKALRAAGKTWTQHELTPCAKGKFKHSSPTSQTALPRTLKTAESYRRVSNIHCDSFKSCREACAPRLKEAFLNGSRQKATWAAKLMGLFSNIMPSSCWCKAIGIHSLQNSWSSHSLHDGCINLKSATHWSSVGCVVR